MQFRAIQRCGQIPSHVADRLFIRLAAFAVSSKLFYFAVEYFPVPPLRVVGSLSPEVGIEADEVTGGGILFPCLLHP